MNLQQQTNLTWSARKVIIATLTAAAVVAGFWLIYRYRLVILILFSAILVATALKPLNAWFVDRRVSKIFSMLIVYFLLAAILVGLLWSIVPIFIEQSLELTASVPLMYQDLRSAIVNSPILFLSNLALYLPSNMNLLVSNVAVDAESVDMVPNVIAFFAVFFKVFLAGVAIFLLTSFWILEGDRAVRSTILNFPPRYRQEVQTLFEEIEDKLGAFVRGQIILSTVIGIFALIAYLIIGLPNALVLALIAGIFEAVPIFGPALGALPAMLVAFAIDPTAVVWVILSTSVIQLLENYLLVPRVMGTTVGVNPIITLLVLATFSTLLGIPGALLAVPSAAIIQLVLYRYVLSSRIQPMELSAGRGKTSALRYEVQDLIRDLRKQLRKKQSRSDDVTDQIEDSIETVAIELDSYLKDINKESLV